MSALDTVDDLAERIALGFVLLLVGLMFACTMAMVGLMWRWATTELGLIAGTVVWLFSVTIAFSVAWAGHMSQDAREARSRGRRA